MRIWLAVMVVAAVACGASNKQSPTCGNGKVDSGEDCDGDPNCTAMCTWACSDPAADCATMDCQMATCSADHACEYAAANDGGTCGSDGHCNAGACISAHCGNGVVEAGEQCDFGVDNGIVAGCEINCMFTCSALQNNCDDGNPCNGTETCGTVMDNSAMGQACLAGTAEMDGTGCGTNMVCKGGLCAANVCGDGYVAGTEECDDANQTPGDGCENNCTFSCVSTDSTRNCTPADPCNGQGTCNDTTHVCAPGTPLTNGTSCGGNNYCKQGTCTMPVCGNGIVEPGEDCDGGVGCKADCHWLCVNAATDCGTAPACEMYQCTGQHTCQAVADSSQNNMPCGTGGTCNNGTCTSGPSCGNGIVEGTEQCDFGNGNGAGTGCETNCQYSCQNDAGCSDGNLCDGTETCSTVTVNGNTGKKCAAGSAPPDGTSCGTGKICVGGSCNTSRCGDGVRVTGEDCDDGNTTNLDGCDGSCKFEQVQRLNAFKVAFMHSTTCTKDALGEAIVGNDLFGISGSRTQITQAIENGIKDGSITVDLAMLGLDDLTGTADSSVHIGVIGGTPAASTAVTLDGTNDLDWWYTTDTATVDASRVPLHQLSGSFAARTLSTMAGEIKVTVSFVGVAVTMDIFHSTLAVGVNASSALTMSTNGMTPGHLASEQDAPTLTSFLTMGTAGTTTGCSTNISTTCRCFNMSGTAGKPATCPSGELCGLVTARSLYNVLMPSALATSCSGYYSTANRLLDTFISGCKVVGLTEVKVQQPDSAIDAAGNPTTDVYVFTPASNGTLNHSVELGSCTKNGVADTLNDCLDHAAYSSLFQFTTDRIIPR